MKNMKSIKKVGLVLFTMIFIITNTISLWLVSASSSSTQIVYPLKTVSKLECRYDDYDELSKGCKQKLPILKTKDYKKYSSQNGWYNDYTRFYTVLWWASYKYGWDVWYGWHGWTDIASSRGTPVYSIAKWKVIEAKKALGWWKFVTVEHYVYGKKVFSNYAHLDKITVNVWDRVNAWEQIWTVWNTWNSTWNHLHLQIDLNTKFHPYYYDWKKCPYSYKKITEQWVCFDELKKNTIDPLLFLETKWKIVKNLKTMTQKVTINKNKPITSKKSNKKIDIDIFDKTVYRWYSRSDIREVQQIFRDLELYDWGLTWDYSDIENIILKYQIDKWVVKNKSSLWAWWFWPKTRAMVKIDYDKFLKSGKKHNYVVITNKNKDSINSWNTIQKIERKNMMTREEIEAREYENFIKNNKFDLDLKNIWGNIKLWTSAKIDFKITKKYKDKPFRWNTPLNISIVTDERILKVFPKKFYNFSDGKREITLNWVKSWITNVAIKFWSKTIKTYKIRVYSPKDKIYLESWNIYWSKNVILSNSTKAIALFRDKTKKNLINIEYHWTYKLKWSPDTKVCIKKWSIKNLSKVHKKSCNRHEYKREIDFNYSDTIAWILFFDYKSTWDDAKIEIINTYNNAKLADKKLKVSYPKWLKNNYVYKDDVIKWLKNDIISNSSKWYFLEQRAITQYDSNLWIRNTLNKMRLNSYNEKFSNKISQNLNNLIQESNSKIKTLTRKEFLEKAHKYLVFTNINSWNLRDYKDLNEDWNKKAYGLFWNSLTWKDRFGENYFQPNKQITRWEVAFILNNAMFNNTNLELSLK